MVGKNNYQFLILIILLLLGSCKNSSSLSGSGAKTLSSPAKTTSSSAVALKISGTTNINNNSCVPYTVISADSAGLSADVTQDLTVAMNGEGAGGFYSDSACITEQSTVTIAAGTSLSYVYYSNPNAQNLVFSATAKGISATTFPVTVTTAGNASSSAVKFALTGPNSLRVQECSSAFIIKSTNSSGVEFTVSSNTTVNITGKGGGNFYSDAACTSIVSSVVFSANDSSKPFYYKGTTVESLTFNVDDVGSLTPASTGVAIVADLPSKLIVTGSTPITLGDCSAFNVTVKDLNNFSSAVQSTTSINLTGAGAGTFYSDSSCIGSTASVAISSGQSSALFYYKSLSSGIVTLSADNSGALTAGTKAVTVDALPYTKVIFSRPSIVAGNCATVTISLKDSLNNTSPATSSVGVSLASSGSSVFYSAGNCASGVITSATVAISQSSTTVYLKDTVAETITLGATSTGLTSDSWNTTVAAGSNNALKLVGPATNSVGSCTAYDLRLEDSLGNLSLAVSSTSVNFTGLSKARFYSDVNCTTLASSGTILAASALTQVYLKGNVAESVTIAANSGSLVAASKAVSLIAGSSNKLIINGVATALAGACTALSVEVQDSLNNPITQGAPLVATMSGNVSGSFYSELGCTVAATTATIALSNSSATIWFKSNIPSSLSLNAQGPGLFDGTKNFSINPLAPTKLVMTGSTNITAGVCTAYSISLEDTLNNMSSAGNSKILNFSGGLSGAFYSDSSCALPASSISLTSTQTTAQIYYKASAAQTPNLLVDDSGLPDLVSSTLPVTVVSSGGSSTISLKISGSTSINTSSCVPYAIITTDTSGLSYNVTNNTSVTLGGAGTGLFYSNSICTTASPTVTIASGTSLSYIYYSSATAQNLVFSAIASGASANTLPVAVVSGAASFGASRLTIAGSSSISTGSCIPYVVSVADLNGNSVNAVANTTVSFAGKGLGDFYSNDTCSTSAAGSAVVSAATSYTTIYYKNTNIQNLIFVAQSTGLSNGTLSVGITSTTGSANSGPAVKLSFVAQPSSVASTNENFGEQPIVIVQDSNNNVASSSSATITLAAYADNACSLSAGPILQATTNPLISNGGVANFAGVKITSALAIYLKASSPGLASICSQAVQVYPSVPSKLSFSLQPSTTAIAGDGLTIQPQVSVLNYTNQVLTNAINAVSISAYTDSTCSTSATGIFNLGVNNVIPSVGVVAFSGISYSIASTIYLKATSSGLTSACSSGITVSPAPAYQLGVYYQPAAAGKAGDTFSLTTRLYDSFGNTSLSTHNLTLTAYKSNNCTGSTSVITGQNSTTTLGTATFASIVFAEASTMSLKISDLTDPTVYVACSTAIMVDGGAPSKLSFSTQPSSTSQIYLSLATPPAVMVQDSFSNQVKSATTPITLSAYSDSGCSTTPALGALTAINLTVSPTGGISTFGSVSVTYSLAQVIYLKAASSGLTSACSSPIALTNLSTKISTRGYTSCGVVSGGVKCWGYNGAGQLGDSSKASTPYPAMVTNTNGYGALSGIAVGNNHACAHDSAGAVYCWGYNDYGQLGDATGTERLIPVQVVGVTASGFLSNIVSITAGNMHTCALSNTGAVYCWGYNGHGQLGDNTTTSIYYPTQVKGVGGTGLLSSISSISAGDNHTCAVSSTGAAYCWGYNVYGQLGDNTSGTNRLTPIQVKGVGATGNLANIISISAGTLHTCAASSSGAAYCWGYNASGQLGDNTLNNSSTPIQVIGVGGTGNLANIISISAGGNTANTGHTCAINSSRNLFCWGYNASGQLGDNTTTNRSTPTQVLGVGASGNLSSIISVSAGTNGTCALSDDGYMYCWGNNTYWQLGDQTTTQRNTPVKVKENSNTFTSVSNRGTGHACGISNEKVYCWGNNDSGQLGDGTASNKNLPKLVPNLNGVKQVSTMYFTTCAVLNTGAVYCWGNNYYGQLGDGTTTSRATPVQVSGLSNATYVSTSNGHSCAVTSSGAAYCWGTNTYGQLGNNSTANSYTPVLVSGGLNFVSIETAGIGTLYSSTSGHSCGITNTGAAYCWGHNGGFQLGNGGSSNSSTPVLVNGLSSGVTAIESYEMATCAIQSGALRCWAYFFDANWSVTNLGSTPSTVFGSGVTSMSVTMSGICGVVNGSVACYHPSGSPSYMGYVTNANTLKDIKSISMGYFSNGAYGSYVKMCVLKNNGVLYCSGQDNYSVHNYGTVGATSTPTIVAIPPTSSNTLTSVAVGETQSCGILNGVVQCWGTSAAGALGSGLTTSLTPNPVLLASTSSYLLSQASVAAGGTHSCSLSTIGDVYCWGDNSFGKLGNNSTVASNKAIQVLGAGGIGTLASVASLAVGYRHNCAVISGYTYCWGYNTSGQLGIDSTMTMGSATQVMGVGGTGYLGGSSKVVAGRAHTCSLVSGNVYCWGSNQYGQLGANSSVSQSNTPLKVVSVSGVGTLNNVTSIAAGAYHTCALASGIIYCWGANSAQQLGNGATQDSSYPVGVMNSDYITLSGVTSISAGVKHSCAITSVGEVYCWGSGAYGQLGLNATVDVGAATKVLGLGGTGVLTANMLATGSSANHSCAISTDQTNIYCWGLGTSGQMGNNASTSAQLYPTPFTYSSILYLMVR